MAWYKHERMLGEFKTDMQTRDTVKKDMSAHTNLLN